LARARAQAAQYARLLLQPVARRRLGAVGAIQAQPSPKLGHLSAKTLDLACLSRYQGFDFRRKTHPTLESEIRVLVAKNRSAPINRAQSVAFRTHHGLAVTPGALAKDHSQRSAARFDGRSIRPQASGAQFW